MSMLGRKIAGQMSESLLVGCLLAWAGGFLETYSFFTREGVFANCQTGNLVMLAMRLTQQNFQEALLYFIPIFAFFLGVLLTDLLRDRCGNRFFHWRQPVLLLEILLLITVGLLPQTNWGNPAATTLISFSCAMQVESFRKIGGSVYATTMCTGNLRSGTSHLASLLLRREAGAGRKALRYFVIIAVFMTGAACGTGAATIWEIRAVWIACLVLLCVFFLLFCRPLQEE